MRPELSLFDRNPDPALNELVELAAVLCDADYAYIGWMDFNRLWFKARFGFKATDQPRATTACQWVLEKGESLLIADAGKDPRFPPEGIPLAGASPCLSYAAAPLITGNENAVGVIADMVGELFKYLQTGRVQNYAFGIVAGMLVLVVVIRWVWGA